MIPGQKKDNKSPSSLKEGLMVIRFEIKEVKT
jgi:hypothetical protein